MNQVWLKQMNWSRSSGMLRKGVQAGTVKLLALSLIIVSGFGCSKEVAVPKVGSSGEEAPTQYGVPFNNVPQTSDIVMYEVNLWAFSSAGNLNGVQARLDEIKDLGVNVIWLMPIYPTGDLKSVGSPYAVKNYTEVNPAFGDLEDLRALVREAHDRDMAVILDWVANHTAWDHPWIQNPNWYARDAAGHIISPPGMGWNDVAELNYSSQAMRKEMIAAMKYWILEANVDGFRVDHAEGVPTNFWWQAIDILSAIPDRDVIMFAEGGDKELLTAGFDLIFGWSFYDKLKEVFDNNASAASLAAVNAAEYNNVPAGSEILRWIDNHDKNAWEDTPINVFKSQAGSLAAFVLASYMGGVPLMYNGQEVGYPGRLSFFNNSTTKIDWTVNPEIRSEYKKLLAFRNSSEAIKEGYIETYPSDDVVSFRRVSGTEEVLVMVNVRNSTVNYQLPSSLANTTWQEALSNEAITLNQTVFLEPFSYLILKK